MDEHDIEIKVLVNAKKEIIIAAEAMEKVLEANRVVAAKGKKLVEFTLKGGELQGDVSLEDLQKAIIGPSGNLRAPTLFRGKTWYVGFHPDMYAELH